MGSWWKTPWQFIFVSVCGCGRKEVRDERGLARGLLLFRVPALRSPCRPATAHWWFPPLGSGGGEVCGGVVELVLLALSLESARQFIKAFGERGGNLHVT